MTERRSGARGLSGRRGCLLALWLGGLEDGARIKGYVVVRPRAACVQREREPGIDCSGN